MAEWDSIPGSTIESTDLNETAKCERRWGGGVVRCEDRPSLPFVLLRLQMQVEDFRSAGVKLMLGAVFVDFTYSSPSLACKCELEDFHPMRGV